MRAVLLAFVPTSAQLLNAWLVTSYVIGIAVVLGAVASMVGELFDYAVAQALREPPRDADLLDRQQQLSAAALSRQEHQVIPYGPRRGKS